MFDYIKRLLCVSDLFHDYKRIKSVRKGNILCECQICGKQLIQNKYCAKLAMPIGEVKDFHQTSDEDTSK